MNLSVGRILQLLLTMVFASAIAIGCSNNSPDSTTSNPTSPGEYRLVKDAIASIKVPLDPQRIVTLHGMALESVLALGDKPIGTTLNGKIEQQPKFLGDQLTNIEILGSFGEPNLEKILLLKPDLILDLDTGDIYSQLSQISPIIVSEFNSGDSWQPSLSLYAEALGKSKVAEQIIADYYQRLEQLKAELAKQSKAITVSVIRIYPDSIAVYQPDSFSGSILKDAGLSRPPSQNKTGVQTRISKELIGEADADVIFLWAYGDDYNSKESQIQQNLSQLKSDPLWSQLKAVRQGKVYQVPDYWIGYGSLAANAVLDDLFEYLVEE